MRGSYLNKHVSMEFREGVSGQTATQVESIAVLRHNVLNLHAEQTKTEHEALPLNVMRAEMLQGGDAAPG